MKEARFQNLNFDTKVSTSQQEDVVVTISDDSTMIADYAKAYFAEARRVNPTYVDESSVTQDDLGKYLRTLLKARIDSITPEGCKDWRKFKQCCIPDFFQFVLSTIGIVTDHASGLKFIPTYDSEDISTDWDFLLNVSNFIERLSIDGLAAEKDALPRGTEGDKDVMGFIITEGYVFGRTSTQAPICSYVAAFLGLKLVEETSWKLLYRVRYDDVNFIHDSLMHERSIIAI